MTPGHAILETAIGPCGLAWSEKGLTHVELPASKDESAEKVRMRLLRRAGPSEEKDAKRVLGPTVKELERLLEGEPVTLQSTPIDLSAVPPFHRRVYEALRKVPPGRTVSYAELARAAGSPAAFRAVGQAMAKNPLPLVVPCHRVLAAGKRIGGFSAAGGTASKVELLALEGVTASAPKEKRASRKAARA